MKCPYSDSLMPRCQITMHPHRQNIEYCRTCGEWRYLSDVGDEFPNVFWLIVALSISMMVFVGLVNESDTARRQQEQRRRDRDYLGQSEHVEGQVRSLTPIVPEDSPFTLEFS
ncbi:MAG: hypothetical protein IGS48_25000 [Oscillatoriales cyanobacterium C42_A2020_001]|nr:hypothetical protein [Leptolyngbyaceae cyanobacterium C42_A2020_001]